MITRRLFSFLRSLRGTRAVVCKDQAAPKSFVPIPPPASGMLYDEPRDVLIENLIKEIRHHAHPAALAVPDQTCDICDTEALRQTLEGYSDDLLHTLVSHQRSGGRGNGTYLAAHEGKDEAYVRTFFFIRLSKELDKHFAGIGRDRNFLNRHAAFAVTLYERLPYEDSTDYYRKAIALTGAVLEIMRAAQEEGISTMSEEVPLLRYYGDQSIYAARIASDDLAEFICEHTDQWEQIAEIAVQRRTTDPSTIKGILDARTTSSTPSLNSGLL